ncbi:MAG: FtsW/RodA/SpoVE family cell cycle protein, partial [Candidatus Omnitrophica bacterium]|nr:FtsW/RodA/SpoVE family cell cycle protein [Candidatus Omnitrophota bacterium]
MRRRLWHGVDRPLLWTAALLLAIGLVMLYSASYQRAVATGTSYVGRQLIWLGIGAAVAFLLMAMDYHRWLEGAYVYYAGTLALLVVVLAAGETRGGAQRWLAAGPFTFQPSELAKLSTVLVLARYLGERRDAPRTWRAVIVPAAIVVVPIVLILKEPNLGTALIFLPVLAAMLWVWRLPARIWWGVAAAAVIAVPLGWHALQDYQRSRLLVFVNPNLDPLGAGYTVIQSRIAVGSGGLWGKGWLAGTQNQLNFLPERHT